MTQIIIIQKSHFFALHRSYQVRGHLAAQIDPLGLNNMEKEKAKDMIIRSVTVEDKVEKETQKKLGKS